uniref:BZIP domain-containing protein n=2 Tax=Amphora coffeiformis TaxID=265554 RepID=A0A7S3PD26_9STRA
METKNKADHSAVEDALFRLPPNLRRGYETAIQIAPELVRRETPFEIFYKTDNGDPEKAALRLANYWNARRDFFGNRYILPMNQTGSGALSMEDISFLRTGFLVVLPRPSGQGLIVLYDEGRLPRSPGPILMRCTFYVTAIYPVEMQDVTIIHVVAYHGKSRPPVDLDPKRWEVLRTALPMRVTKVLVAQEYVPHRQGLIDFMGFSELRATEYKSRLRLNRIAANSVQKTLHLLQNQGLETECLPHCLGGQYDYGQFNDWVRMRMSIEDIMSSSPLSTRYRPCAVPQVTSITSVKSRGALKRVSDDLVRRKYQDGTKGNKSLEEAQKRERNAMYSRRSFNKRQLETLTLQNQCQVLTTQNDNLKLQNRELEDALLIAQQLVASATNVSALY